MNSKSIGEQTIPGRTPALDVLQSPLHDTISVQIASKDMCQELA